MVHLLTNQSSPFCFKWHYVLYEYNYNTTLDYTTFSMHTVLREGGGLEVVYTVHIIPPCLQTLLACHLFTGFYLGEKSHILIQPPPPPTPT